MKGKKTGNEKTKGAKLEIDTLQAWGYMPQGTGKKRKKVPSPDQLTSTGDRPREGDF